jgi:hypothetical protein
MRRYGALGGLMLFGASLLPFVAFADSQLASGTHGPLTATAHLRFRIIIPTVLSLEVADSTRTAGTQTVTVTSNSHNLALGATLGNSIEVTRRVVLSAAARKGIAQDAPCAAQGEPAAAASPAAHADSSPVERMLCTVSMP